jgi:hypothetical protein
VSGFLKVLDLLIVIICMTIAIAAWNGWHAGNVVSAMPWFCMALSAKSFISLYFPNGRSK